MTDAVEMMLEELAEQKAQVEPFLEGLRDSSRALNKPEEQATRQTIDAHAQRLQDRLTLIGNADDALKKLDAHGFDTVPDLQLPDEQFQIWEENHRTHEAAVARTKGLPPPATGGTFELSEGQDKPNA